MAILLILAAMWFGTTALVRGTALALKMLERFRYRLITEYANADYSERESNSQWSQLLAHNPDVKETQ